METYSEYNCSKAWGLFKNNFPDDRSESAYCRLWESVMQSYIKDVGVDETLESAVVKMTGWGVLLKSVMCIKYKKANHYFLDSGVASFCTSSVKTIVPDFCKALPEKTDCGEIPLCGGTNMVAGFFLHFPMHEKRKSLYIEPEMHGFQAEKGEVRNAIAYAACTDGNVTMAFDPEVWNDEDAGKQFAKTEQVMDPFKTSRLVMGFSLYIDAFPDVVREADNIKHVGHYKGHRHSVRANEIVRTEATHSVSPHFRRGHFRLLSSDKFKHKRGQTIFIKGMFVKGHAFDVLADSETAVQS